MNPAGCGSVISCREGCLYSPGLGERYELGTVNHSPSRASCDFSFEYDQAEDLADDPDKE